MISLIFIENWSNSLYFQALAWNFLTYFHLIHQNIYVKNNLEDSDTVVRHPNAFLEYLKPLESVLSRFDFYFRRKKLKNTTNAEGGTSTLGGGARALLARWKILKISTVQLKRKNSLQAFTCLFIVFYILSWSIV